MIIMIRFIFLFYSMCMDSGAATSAMVIHGPETPERMREKEQITVLSVQYCSVLL